MGCSRRNMEFHIPLCREDLLRASEGGGFTVSEALPVDEIVSNLGGIDTATCTNATLFSLKCYTHTHTLTHRVSFSAGEWWL